MRGRRWRRKLRSLNGGSIVRGSPREASQLISCTFFHIFTIFFHSLPHVYDSLQHGHSHMLCQAPLPPSASTSTASTPLRTRLQRCAHCLRSLPLSALHHRAATLPLNATHSRTRPRSHWSTARPTLPPCTSQSPPAGTSFSGVCTLLWVVHIDSPREFGQIYSHARSPGACVVHRDWGARMGLKPPNASLGWGRNRTRSPPQGESSEIFV
ncbi:hypothetical protein B0H14DRAFT_1039930 [Mycena olivaceomarginata]|nr:hypothetical protein B0H14DRAFT_1039930 [Mycena olivaceomarginata]